MFGRVEKLVFSKGIDVQIIYLGDSHAHALVRAIAKSGDHDVLAVDVRRIKDPTVNSKEIPDDLQSRFPTDKVFCCLGGTEYNLLGLIESAEPFDFLYHADDVILPGRTLIPHGTMRAALDALLRSLKQRTEKVHAQFDCPFFCVAPPPPFAELEGSEKLPNAFAPLVSRGIAPRNIRRKLYNLQIDIMEDHCREREMGFLHAPVETQDSDGYLLREFWDRDPTHGNAAYGQAVIEQLRAYSHG